MTKRLVNTIFFVVLGFSLAFNYGCSEAEETKKEQSDSKPKDYSKGTIKYKVSYPYFKGDGLTKAMLPKEMYFVFHDGKINQYSKKGGLLKMGVMGEPSKDSVSIYIDFGKADFRSNFSGEKVREFIQYQTDLEIDLIEGEEKEILGFKCKKALVKYKNGAFPDFTVYYTEELEVENPNFYNPYASIPGVLMEFEMERFGLVSKIEADTFMTTLPEEHQFDLDTNFMAIQFQSFENEIRTLFEKTVGKENLSPNDSIQ